jgi:hypothetical protein
MNKWTVTVMLFVVIIVHQEMELPTNQDTPVIGQVLAQAVRARDADLHTHQETPSGLDQSSDRGEVEVGKLKAQLQGMIRVSARALTAHPLQLA